MKRFLRRFAIFVLLLPFLAVAVLYLPSVQQWAVHATSRWLSQHTGYTLTVGRVSLRPPLLLQLHDLTLAHDTTPLASLSRLQTRLSPRLLLQGCASLPYVIADDLTLHTDSLLRGIRLDGTLQHLRLSGLTYRWGAPTLLLHDAYLQTPSLTITPQATTVPADTGSTPFPLTFTVGALRCQALTVDYVMPDTRLQVSAPSLQLRHLQGHIPSELTLQHLSLQKGMVLLSPTSEAPWQFTDITLQADSLRHTPSSLQGILSRLTLSESHGLALHEGRLTFLLTPGKVQLPQFSFRTASSSLSGHLRTAGRHQGKWLVSGDAHASLGYPDVQLLAARLPQLSPRAVNLYPSSPLTLSLGIEGPVDALHIEHCHIALPTAFEATLRGQLIGSPLADSLQAHIALSATTHDLTFLTPLLPSSLQQRLAIPPHMQFDAQLRYAPDTLHTRLTARLAGGSAQLEGGWRPSLHRYSLSLQADTLDMHHLLPSDPLGEVTLQALLEGEGLPLSSTPHHADCSLWVDSLVWDHRLYSQAHLQGSLSNRQLLLRGSYADSLMQLQLRGGAEWSSAHLRAHLSTHISELHLQALGLTEADIRPSLRSYWMLGIDSSHTYTLRGHLYDMTLATPKLTVHPQPISLRLLATPDTIALSALAGDLRLLATAHTAGLPWHWPSPLLTAVPAPLTASRVELHAGPDNPIANYLALTGITTSTFSIRLTDEGHQLSGYATTGPFTFGSIEADTATLTASYHAGTLHARLSSHSFAWHTPAMQLAGSASAVLTWPHAFRSDSLSGSLQLSSLSYNLPAYSLQLHTADTLRLPFAQGRLLLADVPLYASGSQPLLLHGTVTLLGAPPSLQLQLHARDVSLLQRQPQRGTLLYGTARLSGRATLSGPFTDLRLDGDLTLRSGTDLHYIYQNASLTTGNSLADVITFTDFTAPPAGTPPPPAQYRPGGFSMYLTTTIDPTAQLEVLLGSSGENTGTLQGGGTLSIQYIPATGLRLSGKYTVSTGQLLVNIPLLHVHHLTIRPGSSVTWSGNALNPILDLTAENRVLTSVTLDNSPQTVLFITGISLTDTVERLGLQFTLSAPENASMQNLLAALPPDERSKLAVGLLTTGLYLGEGGTGNLMNSALMGFLQSQLDNISRSTFRSVDVSFGIKPLPDGVSGVSTRTGYTFSVAKRFWRDRLRIIVGGSVTTSNERIENDAIIDNVSVEWRITPNGNQYLRIFYDKNFESILEGEIREAGAGYIYRRQF